LKKNHLVSHYQRIDLKFKYLNIQILSSTVERHFLNNAGNMGAV